MLCQGETARQGCRALQLTGSACQIVKRALQLIRDGGQVMSVRKKALDREGCFYYALALGIELGRQGCFYYALALGIELGRLSAKG